MAEYRGIDVSHWNGVIDWSSVKAAGYTFAIVKLGHKGTMDKRFLANVNGALAAGMGVGVYLYSYATTMAEARAEAAYAVKTLSGAGLSGKLAYPVAFDMETAKQRKTGKAANAAIINAFCADVRAAGYIPALYTNPNWLLNYIDQSKVDKDIDLWLAHHGAKEPRFSCAIWQYTDSGKVPGIGTNTDLDIAYKEYVAPAPKPAPEPAKHRGMVTVRCHIRAAAGTQYRSLGILPVGTVVSILGTSGKWTYCDTGNIKGYVYSAYVESGATKLGKTTAKLNLRAAASTSAAVVTVIPKGGTVTLYELSAGWWRCKYGGVIGYAAAKYIR